MSKSIIIMRHALSENGGWLMPDADRHILPEGIRQTEEVARKMLDSGLVPDMVWTSHAQRAIETAQVVLETLNVDVEQQILRILYGEEEESVIEAVCLCDNSTECLLVVAHNPLVSRLASRLSGSSVFGWFATSDLVWLEFDTDDWSKIMVSEITNKTKISSVMR
ncbi:MAG: histidine phosphatase family protein [Salinivirgaceae bacterium]|nr:histidine phosphatase family protein [Salinivirgaceae bacterium]